MAHLAFDAGSINKSSSCAQCERFFGGVEDTAWTFWKAEGEDA